MSERSLSISTSSLAISFLLVALAFLLAVPVNAQDEEVTSFPVYLLWLQLDSDADGVKNSADAFPQNPLETLDTDGDGVGNNSDIDDDADGVADAFDAFPLDSMEWTDTDGDGLGNNSDLDDDGDGVSDDIDVFPLNSDEWLDTDADGLGDNADIDDDNDGTPDDLDTQPLKPEQICAEYLENAPENTFRYCWEETIESFTGAEYSSHINQAIEVEIEGDAFVIPDNSHAELLYLEYGIVLDEASGWTEEQAYALHKVLERIPLAGSERLQGLVLRLKQEFLPDDIEFDQAEDGSPIVSLGVAAFDNANPRLAQIDGQRGVYFSNRLHRALVRLVTQNGSDLAYVNQILRVRYGISVDIPDYVALTGERADRFQPFRPRELVDIIAMFEEMPTGYHKISGLDYLVRRLDGTCHPGYGCEVQAIAWTGSGYIEFMESAFESVSTTFLHRLILHEKAHFLWAKVFDEKLKQAWIDVGGWYQCTEKSSGWCSRSQTQFVSAYAHLKNPDEDFAETTADFIVNPDIVRSRAPTKYQFIRDRVMAGTIYLAQIREDLTFTVYNLYPDYVYPGKIKRVRVEVAGLPEEDKDVTIQVDIHALDLALEGAQSGYTRLESEEFSWNGLKRSTFVDVGLSPVDPVNGLSNTLIGYTTLSKFRKAGLWRPEQISISDVVGNSRYSGANDFGWRMFIDNPLEDLVPPLYVPGSVALELTQMEYQSNIEDVVVATWEAEEVNPRGDNGCYASMNDELLSTASTYNYGFSDETGCRVEFLMPTYKPDGIYSMTFIQNYDLAGNESFGFFRSDFTPEEEPTDWQDTGEMAATVEIVSENPDTTPPEIDLNQLSVTAEPTNPESPNGETVVEFTFRVRDDISGYRLGDYVLRDPQGMNFSYGHQHPRFGDLYPLPGETDWQEYQSTVVLPAGSAPGTWGVAELIVEDRAGNNRRYNFVEIVTFDVIE